MNPSKFHHFRLARLTASPCVRRAETRMVEPKPYSLTATRVHVTREGCVDNTPTRAPLRRCLARGASLRRVRRARRALFTHVFLRLTGKEKKEVPKGCKADLGNGVKA